MAVREEPGHGPSPRKPSARTDGPSSPTASPAGLRAFLAAAPSGLPSRLFEPVDISSIVFFRIAFGAVLLVGLPVRYALHGWIDLFYIDPAFHFTYLGFDWVRPWPGIGMYLHFLGLGVLATFIMVGLWYRVSVALFFLGFTYLFLLDEARYLNHYYLVCLISFLLIFIPAHRAFSLDALRRPDMRTDTAPRWALWLLRIQIGVVYFYGGLAKLNGDWLNGQPMINWLSERTDFPLIGWLFVEPSVGLAASYIGLLLDLLAVPFLLWPRTRPFAYAAALLFHLMNAQLWNIGLFPWFMIAATLLFFDPAWPRRLVAWLGLLWQRPGVERARPSLVAQVSQGRLAPGQRAIVALLALYVAVQLLVPLRHVLYPGNASWTVEGHRFAWRMLMMDKSSAARFDVFDPNGARRGEAAPLTYPESWQMRKMQSRPDLILQFSHYIAEQLEAQGFSGVQVRAQVVTSLNARRPQPLVDPAVDLAAQRRSLRPARWIMPLNEPLSPRE